MEGVQTDAKEFSSSWCKHFARSNSERERQYKRATEDDVAAQFSDLPKNCDLNNEPWECVCEMRIVLSTIGHKSLIHTWAPRGAKYTHVVRECC